MQHLSLGILIISLILTVPFSLKEGEEFKSKNPKLLPFAWGFFVGYMGVVFSVISAASLFIGSGRKYGSASAEMVALGVFMLLTALIHVYMIKRNKWAWLLGIIISFNPILWIVNGIYLKNRWHEMGGRTISFPSQVLFEKSTTQRYLLAGSAFWAFSVTAFVFMFEPFDSYSTANELAETFKIIIFPIIIGTSGYILYVKLIRPNTEVEIISTKSDYGLASAKEEQKASFTMEQPINSQPEASGNSQRPQNSTIEHMVRYNGVLVRVSELEKLKESTKEKTTESNSQP